MDNLFDLVLFGQQVNVEFVWGNLILLVVPTVVIILLVSGKKLRKLAAILLGISVALVMVAALTWVPVKKRSMPVVESQTHHAPIASSMAIHNREFDGLSWPTNAPSMAVEEFFNASPFKYRTSAVRGLARQCRAYLLEMNLHDVETLYVQFKATEKDARETTNEIIDNTRLADRAEFTNELSLQLPPDVKILFEQRYEVSDDEVAILLEIVDSGVHRNLESVPEGTAPRKVNGSCSAEVLTPGFSKEFRTEYQHKEWVTNFETFNANNGHSYLHVVGEMKANSQEATAAAIRVAAKKLAPMLVRDTQRALAVGRVRGPIRISQSELEHRLLNTLRESEQSPAIVDRYYQRLNLADKGIDSFREELLLYPQGFEPIIASVVADHQHQRASIFFRFVSLAGLVGVVLLTYFSANAATQGYATVVIGVSCAILFFGGFVVILFVS